MQSSTELLQRVNELSNGDAEKAEKIKANMAVFFAAKLIVENGERASYNFLTSTDKYDTIHDLAVGEGCNEALAKGALTYAMMLAYESYTGNDGSLHDILDALRISDQKEFIDFMQSDVGQNDLKGFISTMEILVGATDSIEAVEHLIVNNFNNDEIVEVIEKELDSFNHHCPLCDQLLSECVAVIDEAVAPDCTNTGLTEGKHCSVCGEVLIAQETVDALGHTEGQAVTENKVEPTYNSKGSYDTVVYCSVCGAELSRVTTTVDALAGVASVNGINFGTLIEAMEAARAGEEIVLLQDVDVSATLIDLDDLILDFNGHTVTGTVLGQMMLNGGMLITTEGYKMIGDGADYYQTEDAVFSMTLNAKGALDITITSGTVTLAQSWWTLENQTLTIDEDATFVIPDGMTLNVLSEVVVKGTVTVGGIVNLYTADATVAYKDNSLLHRIALEVGDKVLYLDGKYVVHNHTVVIDVAVAPDCTNAGLTEGTHCSVCNEVLVAQETVDALGHTDEIIPYVPATCTTAGSTEGLKCSVCGEVRVAVDVIPALGHTPGAEATCTTAQICTVCDTVLVGIKGHTEEAILGKDATCTETGLTDGKKCSVCGEILTAQEEIPAKGHDYEDGKCLACDQKQFVPNFGVNAEDSFAQDGTTTTTFIAGTNLTAAPLVTVTSPDGGWKLGEENVFTVSSTDDIACVVIVKDAEGNYTRLQATTTEGEHSFTSILTDECEIIVAVKGDANGDGVINNKDITLVKRLSNQTSWSDYELCVMNISGNDSTIGNKEITLIKRVANGTHLDW